MSGVGNMWDDPKALAAISGLAGTVTGAVSAVAAMVFRRKDAQAETLVRAWARIGELEGRIDIQDNRIREERAECDRRLAEMQQQITQLQARNQQQDYDKAVAQGQEPA